jgi:hypothetical protein
LNKIKKMQDKEGQEEEEDDTIVSDYLRRVPNARKRLREVAWEELWAAGGTHVPDFSTLPKEIWGMIAARCEVSGRMLTTLLLLNKERISAAAWANFRFPASWDYARFARWFVYKQNFRTRPGYTQHFWELFGFDRSSAIVKVVEPYASICVADEFWLCVKRNLETYGRVHNAMRVFSDPKAILIGISKLLSLYVPLRDHGKTLCVMFEQLGCTVHDWPEDVSEYKETIDLNAIVPPPELTMLKTPLTNVDIALGYYNVYRRNALRDYRVRLPIIELEEDE